jgi:glutathione S-transferase
MDTSFIDPQLKLHLDFLESYLGQSPEQGEYFCGASLTGADVMMIFALEAAALRQLNEQSYPKLYSYIKRVQGREAYKRAAEKVSEASGTKYVPINELTMDDL